MGSPEGVSFGGVIREVAAGVREGVSTAGASVPASDLIPANALGVVVLADLTAVDFVSGFRPETPSEKPVQPVPSAGGVAAGPVTRS